MLQTPQTLIRASTNSDQHTYKTITTIATAQKQLKQPNKVLLYVPFTKSSTFTALVLPASDSILKNPTTISGGSSSSGSVHKLTIKASTDAKALANTLTFDLIKKGSAVLLSAGAAATAKAAAALTLVREQLLSRGYEVGVLPRFDEGQGKEKQVSNCRVISWTARELSGVYSFQEGRLTVVILEPRQSVFLGSIAVSDEVADA